MSGAVDFGKLDRQNEWKDVECIGALRIGSDEAKRDVYLVFAEKDSDDSVNLGMSLEDFEEMYNKISAMKPELFEEEVI